jgi:hypothetical protein
MHDYSEVEQIIQAAKSGDPHAQQKIFSLLHVRFLPIVTRRLQISRTAADPGEINLLASGFCSSAVQKINDICPTTHTRWSMVRLMSIFNNLLDDYILNLLTEKAKKGNREAENRLFEILRVKLIERTAMKRSRSIS